MAQPHQRPAGGDLDEIAEGGVESLWLATAAPASVPRRHWLWSGVRPTRSHQICLRQRHRRVGAGRLPSFSLLWARIYGAPPDPDRLEHRPRPHPAGPAPGTRQACSLACRSRSVSSPTVGTKCASPRPPDPLPASVGSTPAPAPPATAGPAPADGRGPLPAGSLRAAAPGVSPAPATPRGAPRAPDQPACPTPPRAAQPDRARRCDRGRRAAAPPSPAAGPTARRGQEVQLRDRRYLRRRIPIVLGFSHRCHPSWCRRTSNIGPGQSCLSRTIARRDVQSADQDFHPIRATRFSRASAMCSSTRRGPVKAETPRTRQQGALGRPTVAARRARHQQGDAAGYDRSGRAACVVAPWPERVTGRELRGWLQQAQRGLPIVLSYRGGAAFLSASHRCGAQQSRPGQE